MGPGGTTDHLGAPQSALFGAYAAGLSSLLHEKKYEAVREAGPLGQPHGLMEVVKARACR